MDEICKACEHLIGWDTAKTKDFLEKLGHDLCGPPVSKWIVEHRRFGKRVEALDADRTRTGRRKPGYKPKITEALVERKQSRSKGMDWLFFLDKGIRLKRIADSPALRSMLSDIAWFCWWEPKGWYDLEKECGLVRRQGLKKW